MWRLFIFLVLVMFKAEASLPDNEAVVMEIRSTAEPENTRAMCNPNYNYMEREQNITYTVLEGELLNIVIDSNVQKFECSDNYRHTILKSKPHSSNGILTDCDPKGEPPQTIRVNNVALQAVRTGLSEKDVDFTAEYQYVDGDVANVACVNSITIEVLTMEYTMPDMPSDVYTIVYILSALGIMVLIAFLVVYLKAYKRCCYRPKSQAEPLPEPGPDPVPAYYENMLSVFIPINQREAEAMENHYEEIQ